jgi:hypothetical protein
MIYSTGFQISRSRMLLPSDTFKTGRSCASCLALLGSIFDLRFCYIIYLTQAVRYLQCEQQMIRILILLISGLKIQSNFSTELQISRSRMLFAIQYLYNWPIVCFLLGPFKSCSDLRSCYIIYLTTAVRHLQWRTTDQKDFPSFRSPRGLKIPMLYSTEFQIPRSRRLFVVFSLLHDSISISTCVWSG